MVRASGVVVWWFRLIDLRCSGFWLGAVLFGFCIGAVGF